MRKKLKAEIVELIRAHRVYYYSCDICGLMFSAERFLEQHHKETGHHNLTLREQMVEGVNYVFTTAARRPISHYWQDEMTDKKPEDDNK